MLIRSAIQISFVTIQLNHNIVFKTRNRTIMLITVYNPLAPPQWSTSASTFTLPITPSTHLPVHPNLIPNTKTLPPTPMISPRLIKRLAFDLKGAIKRGGRAGIEKRKLDKKGARKNFEH